jgi:beta-galactosidase
MQMKAISELLPNISYGGDYNPEQWSEDVWIEDAKLMKKAGVNLVSVGIFSWAVLERREDEFDFGWLDRVMDILHEYGVGVCLATATASVPAWFSKKYPDAAAVDRQQAPYSFGSRQHYSPNSPDYIRHIQMIVSKLAERYKDHPALKMWHVNNEYGCHVFECYSKHSEVVFRSWLKERYQTIDELNDRWGTNFWSQRYNDWEEITLHGNTPTFANPAQQLDYKRFMDASILNLYKTEKKLLREITPDIPIFTNFMLDFKPLNYFEWAQEMDVVTWDSYPDPRDGIPVSHSMWHDLMRSLKKGQPFLVMEQVTSQVNWRDINVIKPPGVMRLLSYSAIGRGSDGIMFFQWRQSRAGAEKFHGAMVPHSNDENSRIYQEVKQLGEELKKLDDVVGSRTDAKVAVIFDWENWWAVELEGKPHNLLNYLQTVQRYYEQFYEKNIPVDFVRAGDDLSSYQLVIAPMLYMIKPGETENLEKFVSQGGTLVVSYFSGIVDENDRIYLGGYPAPLRKLLGICVEEFDPYPENKKNVVVSNNEKAECSIWSDIISLEGAEVLAVFGENWYEGRPAVTKNHFGDGKAIYIGTELEAAFLSQLLSDLIDEKGIRPPVKAPSNVEVLQRDKNGEKYLFIINHNEEEIQLNLPIESTYKNLLTNEKVSKKIKVKGIDVVILQAK